MKLLVLSDLHLEHAAFEVPRDVDYDLVVLAGDIQTPGTRAVRWAQRPTTFAGKPVVLVPGNHEYYGTCIGAQLSEMRDAARGSNVHVLDRDAVTINGVRFIGTTLWTDFQLPVRRAEESPESDVARALEEANRRLMDFRLIDVHYQEDFVRGDWPPRERRRPLRAEDTLAEHYVDRDWLRRELDRAHYGHTVVVTHHGPSRESVDEQFVGDPLTPAFVSHLPSDFFPGSLTLWVHGHTHTSCNYDRAFSKVICNPRGYWLANGSFENNDFNSRLVVDLSLGDEMA